MTARAYSRSKKAIKAKAKAYQKRNVNEVLKIKIEIALDKLQIL